LVCAGSPSSLVEPNGLIPHESGTTKYVGTFLRQGLFTRNTQRNIQQQQHKMKRVKEVQTETRSEYTVKEAQPETTNEQRHSSLDSRQSGMQR
jgi:hypothetical protein